MVICREFAKCQIYAFLGTFLTPKCLSAEQSDTFRDSVCSASKKNMPLFQSFLNWTTEIYLPKSVTVNLDQLMVYFLEQSKKQLTKT